MKGFLMIISAAAMCLTLTACGGANNPLTASKANGYCTTLANVTSSPSCHPVNDVRPSASEVQSAIAACTSAISAGCYESDANVALEFVNCVKSKGQALCAAGEAGTIASIIEGLTSCGAEASTSISESCLNAMQAASGVIVTE